MTPRFGTKQVRNYYDRHTPTFIKLGQGGSVGVIHRPVWAPGIESREQAFRYIENQIAEYIRTLLHANATDSLHVIDLGCGVGSTLCRLARQLPIKGTGITLSPVQAKLAEEKASANSLSQQLQFIEGDFCELPSNIATMDFAYAIESFVHTPDPLRFFRECSRIVRPGGLLAICDDFRQPKNPLEATKAIEQFCSGWHVNTLISPEQLYKLAKDGGFCHESTTDLTQYLKTNRRRDRLIKAFASLVSLAPMLHARFDDLIGGNALRTCLNKGWIAYQLALFRRVS